MEEEGIEVMQADQHFRRDLSRVIRKFGKDWDIIIDDGSHWNDDIRISLGYLFEYLKPGGIYVVADAMWGEVKNEQPRTQTEEVLKIHPREHRVPNVGTLSTQWKDTKSFKCPVMKSTERKYLCENVSEWNIYNRGDLNILTKKK